MLEGEHYSILLTFIKLPFVIKVFVLSIFEWPFYTGLMYCMFCCTGLANPLTVGEERPQPLCFEGKLKHYQLKVS